MAVLPRVGLAAALLAAAAALGGLSLGSAHGQAGPAVRAGADWAAYGGDSASDHFSTLGQITPASVAWLAPAWRVDAEPGDLQTQPLAIGGVLYAFTPSLKVIALDGASGTRLWDFDSGIVGTQPSRGLSWWTDGHERRLFAGIMNRLYALDPATGRPIGGFGHGGFIDLRENLGGDPEKQAVYMTTPGVVVGDLIIVGFRTSETYPAAPGDIRAYDVRTGALRWSFHTLPLAGEPGRETWSQDPRADSGAANNWTGMTVDLRRGIVFVPTGSAVDDFYGGARQGADLYADSLLALDARTGRRLWSFQGVHHDIWDRDFPSPPVLLTVRRGGRSIDAVAQATKQGFLYVFDRVTGRPLFPIEERPVAASTVPGEAPWPTQPASSTPAPFVRQRLTEDDLTRRTPQAHAWALEQLHRFNNGPLFTPFRTDKPTVVFPGFDGGAEWGGQAVDPATGVIYLNANDVAWTGQLADTAAEAAPAGPGARVYLSQCAACHGENRQGSPPNFPALVDVGSRLTEAQIAATVHNGRGRMPGFPALSGADLAALTHYIATGQDAAAPGGRHEAGDTFGSGRFRFTGYNRFLDPDGYPAVAPPWGTLNAIDLNTGRYLWRIPFGEYPELAAKGGPPTGSENYGGPILTASGLLFIGATIYDHKFRAFDARTGKLLWQATLPYSGVATPITYMAAGRQYVVIAASSQRGRTGPPGSAYVAFALPPAR